MLRNSGCIWMLTFCGREAARDDFHLFLKRRIGLKLLEVSAVGYPHVGNPPTLR
jgi:hypothetical protein